MRRFGLPGVLVLGATLLAVGCNNNDNNRGPLTGLAPDFALKDVNPNSATYDSTISPRDYLDHASAWYFGHAT